MNYYVLSEIESLHMKHAINIRISSQQDQTSELGLIETVKEGPSRGDMLLAEHTVLECVICICPRSFHKWMQNHSSIDAAVHGMCRSRGQGWGVSHPTPTLLVVWPSPKNIV